MYLVNTTTLRLEEFIGEVSLPYAILSHTWGAGEVTYEQFRGLRGEFDGEQGWELSEPGLSKIRMACTKAFEAGYDYVWVDTCCIDKRSSAELSEAINSMFSWYQGAGVCFAYLEDVEHTHDPAEPTADPAFLEHIKDRLMHAKWFTRGWTLQELIAPHHIEFFDNRWTSIGTKDLLASIIAEITGIDEPVLLGRRLDVYSVADRMSWAAKRCTTRIEDQAYSLLGIFDINMPLLYGEGGKAFTRLQEEIMRDNNDQSLFAWAPLKTVQTAFMPLFADRALEFQSSNFFVPCSGLQTFTLTNNGIKIHAPILPFHDSRLVYSSILPFVFLVLDCFFGSAELHGHRVALVCRWTDHTETKLARHPTAKFYPITVEAFQKAKWMDVYLMKKMERGVSSNYEQVLAPAH